MSRSAERSALKNAEERSGVHSGKIGAVQTLTSIKDYSIVDCYLLFTLGHLLLLVDDGTMGLAGVVSVAINAGNVAPFRPENTSCQHGRG